MFQLKLLTEEVLILPTALQWAGKRRHLSYKSFYLGTHTLPLLAVYIYTV